MTSSAIVFLIDESISQQQRMAEGTRSKMEGIATSLNSVLRQLGDGVPVDVAVVGYHGTQDGRMNVGSRWGGGLTGRVWVSSAELKNAPLRVETRHRQVPDPVMGVRQESVEFPVWYDPVHFGGIMPRTPAYDFVAETLLARMTGGEAAVPPLVMSFLGELTDADPLGQCVVPLGRVSSPAGFPLLMQIHLGTNMYVPAIKYPSMPQFLPPGAIQEMFHACSVLDDSMLRALQQAGENLAAGAKGLVHNGRMVDLVRFMGLAREYQTQHAGKTQSAGAYGDLPPGPQSIPATFPPHTSAAVPQNIPAGVPNGMPNAMLDTVAAGDESSAEPAEEMMQPGKDPFSVSAMMTGGVTPPPVNLAPPGMNITPPAMPVPPPLPPLPPPLENEPADDMPLETTEDAVLPPDYELHCVPLAENKELPEPTDLPPRNILMLLLVDRSVSDVTYRPAMDAWNRRLDKCHFMLGEISRRGRGHYDVAVVFYGRDVDDTPTVEDGVLGRPFLPDVLLSESAGRVEEFKLQVPNGIGGLISLPRKKLCFEDVTPTLAADPVPAFMTVTEVIRAWDQARPQKILQPMLLHITAGKFQVDQLDDAVRMLKQDDLPPIWLHHWVFTERPHVGMCCPGELPEGEDETIVRLWEQSDPLPGREVLAGIRPGIADDSRGMMVNMDFDILFEVIDTLSR